MHIAGASAQRVGLHGIARPGQIRIILPGIKDLFSDLSNP